MTVSFTSRVDGIFARYRQSGRRPEQGGILLGRVVEGEVVVEEATVPGFGDQFGRFFFHRDRSRAQRAVDRAWRESNGTVIYLGEWHTHPEAYPTPSRRDQEMIRNMRIQTKMEIEFLITVVVGLEGNWVGIETSAGLQRIEYQLAA